MLLDCELGDEGAVILAEALQLCTKLHFLYITGTKTSTKACLTVM